MFNILVNMFLYLCGVGVLVQTYHKWHHTCCFLTFFVHLTVNHRGFLYQWIKVYTFNDCLVSCDMYTWQFMDQLIFGLSIKFCKYIKCCNKTLIHVPFFPQLSFYDRFLVIKKPCRTCRTHLIKHWFTWFYSQVPQSRAEGICKITLFYCSGADYLEKQLLNF